MVAFATLLGPGDIGRGAGAAAADGAGAATGAAALAGCAAAGAAGACGALAGVIIIVPLKRAPLARGSKSCPHARHVLACSVTGFPQFGQNAIKWNTDRDDARIDRNVSLPARKDLCDRTRSATVRDASAAPKNSWRCTGFASLTTALSHA
jgi:hypothetical protein